MKNILITNDDGVNSKGILAAAEAVKDLGNVTIVAPMKQKSGAGRSLTLRTVLPAKKVEMADFTAYGVEGTPVDSVIVAIYSLLKKPPDLLISGINLGENMSSEITTSGTVCAAIEGANHDIPSIAISLHLDEEEKFSDGAKIDFSLSKKILKRIAKKVIESDLPDGVDLLNVNIPDTGKKNAEIVITSLARRMYTARVERHDLPSGGSGYLIDGDAIFDAMPGTDVYAVRVKESVSVTPLTLDFTSTSDLINFDF